MAAARAFATTGAAVLACIGLAGFLIEGNFRTGADLEVTSVAGVDFNGWWSSLLLLAGMAGLALARRAPLVYSALAAGLFGLIALAGFFGAHGGEPVPLVADRLPVATGNAIFASVAAFLALVPFALPAHEGTASGDEPSAEPIGRPRSSRGNRAARRSIN